MDLGCSLTLFVVVVDAATMVWVDYGKVSKLLSLIYP